jgi:predicted outer membrane repeat protein
MFRTALISFFLTSTAFATTWTVDDDGMADFDNIQDAVDAASNGDEIIVAPGTYTSTADEVVNMLGKAVWLHSSQGQEVTIIDGEGTRRGILCEVQETSETVIEGLTIKNGIALDGGGMLCFGSSPTITSCIFKNNYANDEGGALFYYQSESAINNCTFLDNFSADSGGGIYSINSEHAITSCQFINNNSANAGGGAFFSLTAATLNSCEFINNNSNEGGAAYSEYGDPSYGNCIFYGNTATTGGAIHCFNSSNPRLLDSIFCENTPEHIYGVWINDGGTCLAENCDDTDGNGTPDKCESVGDGVHLVPEEYSTIQEAINAAGYGDEIIIGPGTYTNKAGTVINTVGKQLWIHSSNGPEVTIIDGEGKHCVIECVSGETSETVIEDLTIKNGYSELGGGLHCYGSSPTINGCIFTTNTSMQGGGIYSSNSQMVIVDSTLSNNNAIEGGSIYSTSGETTITNCVFANNQANDGAGLYFLNSNSTIEASTFNGNIAKINNEEFGRGGSIYLDGTGSCSISNSSFTNNSAHSGGGIYSSSEGSLSLMNCTFTLNWALPNICGAECLSGGSGGAIHSRLSNNSGDLSIEECTFNDNKAFYGAGGGIYSMFEDVTISNSTFNSNIAGDGGAFLGGSPQHDYDIYNCTFINNQATGNHNNSDPINSGDGGAVAFVALSFTIDQCIFADNLAKRNGSVLYIPWVIIDGGSGFITNCSFENNTVEGNYQDGTGAAVWIEGVAEHDEIAISSSIFCGNYPNNIYGPYIDDESNCQSFDCEDTDNDGWPNECSTVDDGLHLVPEEYSSIQDAIDAAGNGDEVLVSPGVYTSENTAVLNTRGKRIWIHSTEGADETVIDGEHKRRCIHISNGENSKTIIEGFTVLNGYSMIGGAGIKCDFSSPIIKNCVFSNNQTDDVGGGMYNYFSNPTLTNCTFTNNTAAYGGGMFNNDCSPTIDGCTFTDNTADGGGGMFIYIYSYNSNTNLNQCIFNNNLSSFYGGAIAVINCCQGNGPLNLVECTFDNNNSEEQDGDDGKGGAVYANGPIMLLMSGCVFDENKASAGGALHLAYGPTATISSCVFLNNNSTYNGGAIYNDASSINLSSSTFEHNIGGNSGGAMRNKNDSECIINNCTFKWNTAQDSGGGLHNSDSDTHITNSLFENNIALIGDGGAIRNSGSSFSTIGSSFFCGNLHHEWESVNHIFPNDEDSYKDLGNNQFYDTCCPEADINDDGAVDIQDLLAIVAAWGQCFTCSEDLNYDGIVNVLDLLIVIDNWGPCE